MRQLDLLDAPPPPQARSRDPETSKHAARAAVTLQGEHQAAILECLARHGPLGKDGIARHTKLNGVQVARRTVELQRLGLIRATGRTVPSDTGRLEREWAKA